MGRYPERRRPGKPRRRIDLHHTPHRVGCRDRFDEPSSTRVAVWGSGQRCSDEMRLSLQVQYAICASFDLAYSGQGEPIQIRAIADRQAIPQRYLEQIFVRLRRAGLIDSKRGPGGGYRLARPAGEITLCEIVEAVEGPLTGSLEMSAPKEGTSENRPEFLWGELAGRFSDVLGETTLDALCRQAARANLPGGREDAPMYFI